MADLLECLAGMTEGVMAMDGQQRILLWNRAAERLLGVTAKEVLGRHCYEVIRGRDELGALLCRLACDTMTLAKKAKPMPTQEILTLTKGGKQLWLNAMHMRLPSDRAGRVVLAVIFHDVSRHKKIEGAVQQLSTSFARLEAQGRGDQGL